MTELPAWYEWSLYQVATRRTVQKHLTKQEKHYQNCIGISGEVAEVAELILDSEENMIQNKDAIINELGDLLWYMTRLLDEWEVDLSWVAGTQMIDAYNCSEWVNEYAKYHEIGLEELQKIHAQNLVGCVGRITEHFKKVFFHGHDLDLRVIVSECRFILKEMSLVALWQQCTLEDVAKANVEKIAKRYPEGWNEKYSIYRIEEE